MRNIAELFTLSLAFIYSGFNTVWVADAEQVEISSPDTL